MGGERTSALPSGKERVDQLAVNVGDAIRLTSFEVKASVIDNLYFASVRSHLGNHVAEGFRCVVHDR